MGSTGFRIDNDGTIIREPSNSTGQDNGGRKKHWLWIIVILLAGAIGVYFFNSSETGGSGSTYNSGEQDRNKVISTITRYNDAYTSNDFDALLNIYARYVTRYHAVYNWTNEEVVNDYKKYDRVFGVYGKHISVRWNTLQIERLSDNEISVVFVEDYSIDRVDKSKYSFYVLEKHIIFDQDYRIKSIYDVQLEKKR